MHPSDLSAQLADPHTSLDRPDGHGNPTASGRFFTGENAGRMAEASSRAPCPVCGKKSWCWVGPDRVVCKRASKADAPPGWRHGTVTKGGHQMFFLVDQQQADRERERWQIDLQKSGKQDDGRKLTTAQCTELLDQTRSLGWEAKVTTLAELLHVDVEVLHRLAIGWRWGDVTRGQQLHAGSWDYPMRSGDGAVIGVHRRLSVPFKRVSKDGQEQVTGKLMHKGSRLGLVYDPAGWADGTGPILLPEGMTDTATLMHLGLSAVGRPNDRACVDMMAELLRDVPADRPIVVLAEDDRKDDGRWPGLEGATYCARQLATLLRRPVAWCQPIGGQKDVREWWSQQAGLGVSADAAQQLLLDHVESQMQVIEPPAPAPQIDCRTQQPIVPLIDQRAMLRQAVLDLVAPDKLHRDSKGRLRVQPGVHVIRSGTGVGKSHATAIMLVEAERLGLRAIVLSQTHKASAERLAEARALGLTGGTCDPELNDDTCGRFDEASRVRAAGLPVSGTICLGCKLRDICQYRGLSQSAKDAQVRFSTHAKGGIDLAMLTAGRDLVIIDEDLLSAVVRHAAPEPADIELAAQMVRQAAEAAPRMCKDTALLVEGIALAAYVIGKAVAASTSPGLVDVDTAEVPIPQDDDQEQPQWHNLLWHLLGKGAKMPPADAMRLLIEVATGRAHEVYVTRDELPNGLYEQRVVAIDRQKVSKRRLWVTTDATAEAATVQQVVDQPVHDLTPAGRAPDVHQARRLVPIDGDVICGSSPAHATATLRGVLELVPGDRVGLLTHQGVIRPMCGKLDDDQAPEGGGLLDDHEIDRLAMVSHHHGALARGSNQWLGAELTDLVCLGTPNVSPAAVRLRLLLTGQIEAARRPDGGWVDHKVLAGDPEGRTVTNSCRAYSDPQWQVARGQLVHAAIRQEGGRARHTLPEGCRLWLLTAEPVPGMATHPEPVRAIEAPVHHARLVVEGGQPTAAKGPKGQTAKVSIRRLTFCQTPAEVTTGQVIELLGQVGHSQSTAKRALREAGRLGLIWQPGHGRWLPAGCQPAEPSPAPQVVGPAAAGAVDVQLVTGVVGPATIVVTHGLAADFQAVAACDPMPSPQVSLEALPDPQDEKQPHQPTDGQPADVVSTSGPLSHCLPADRDASHAATGGPEPDLAWLGTCTDDEFTRWHEVAAIMQHDGGLPQREAELAALAYMLSQTKVISDVDPQLQVAQQPNLVQHAVRVFGGTVRELTAAEIAADPWLAGKPARCTHASHVDYPIGGSWEDDPKRPGQLHMINPTGLRRHCADCGEFLGWPKWRGKWQEPQRDHTRKQVADPLLASGRSGSNAKHGRHTWPQHGPGEKPRDRGGAGGQHRAPTGPQAAGRR